MRIETSAGPADIDWDEPAGQGEPGHATPAFLLLLTHGSGGGVDTRDLLAVSARAVELGGAVARVTQPYRVAGRRAPGSQTTQDDAWLTVASELRGRFPGVPLIQGGRSNGARVACRTAVAVEAKGVVALSFPLHPPGKPEKTRRDELLAASTAIEVVVINGARDPFGIPDPADAAEVAVIPHQPHSFRAGFDTITATVEPWLRRWSSRA